MTVTTGSPEVVSKSESTTAICGDVVTYSTNTLKQNVTINGVNPQ